MHCETTIFPVLDGDEHSTAGTDRTDPDDIQGVCHDLRGHLATIGMIAAALKADAASEVVATRIDALVSELEASSEMVRRVTTHERRIEVLELDAVVRDAVARRLPRTTCAVHVLLEPVELVADALQIGRLVDNLLDNAVRAAGSHGQVQVRVTDQIVLSRVPEPRRTATRRVLLSVADTGPGFGQGPRGVASLGLHVVRSVLAELGGTLEIGRSDLGGAEVTASIPVRS
jgi:signal transduction histidine kinase